MSIRQKIVAISKEVGMLEFKKTDFQGVDIYTSEYINSMLKPIFDKHGVVPMVNVQYGQDKVTITTQYIHEGEDDLVQTVEHPINALLWGGGNITLATKYAYILMFQIGTKDDVSLKTTRETAFAEPVKKAAVTPRKDLKQTMEEVRAEVENLTPETKEEVTFPDGTPNIAKKEEETILDVIDNVIKDENLEIIVDKPETKEPEPDQALFERINEGNWIMKVAITDCMSEVSVVKALDEQYKMLSTDMYGHKDLDLCPVPIEKVIDLFPRRSNSKIRIPLIQYRVFGEEAAWKLLEATTSRSKADLEIMLENKKAEKPAETLKPIIHKLELPFEISEHIGIDRDLETSHELFANIRKMGLSVFMIIYALGKMKDKPEIDTTCGDDGLVINFLEKASKLQIEEMIKMAMSVAA